MEAGVEVNIEDMGYWGRQRQGPKHAHFCQTLSDVLHEERETKYY